MRIFEQEDHEYFLHSFFVPVSYLTIENQNKLLYEQQNRITVGIHDVF
jgi:hypothetical protein